MDAFRLVAGLFCNGPRHYTSTVVVQERSTFAESHGQAATSWGSPSDASLRDQFTSKAFCRFQLTQFLVITPGSQLIVDPALNPGEDVLAFFGVRLRAAF